MADDRDYRPRDERFRDDRFRDDDRARSGRDQGSGGRGFFERAGDEISSWFGDEEAERRREQDDRSGGYDRYEQGRRRPMAGSHDRDRERGFFGGRDGGGLFGGSDRDEHRYGRPPQFDREPFDRQQFDRGQPEHSHDQGRRDFGGPGYSRSEREEYRPFAGDYGRGSSERHERGEPRGAGAGSMMAAATAAAAGGSSGNHDPHYQEWRQRQIDQLDRDYEEYRREHQSKFDNDFSGWRTQRQTKRQTLGQVREHMRVVGSDDQDVGVVDKVQGDKIILTRDSQGGVHKSLDCTAIDRVEGDRLVLAQPADMARRSLTEEPDFKERNSGDIRGSMGQDRYARQQSQRQGDGPHILERSFSGTYPDDAKR